MIYVELSINSEWNGMVKRFINVIRIIFLCDGYGCCCWSWNTGTFTLSLLLLILPISIETDSGTSEEKQFSINFATSFSLPFDGNLKYTQTGFLGWIYRTAFGKCVECLLVKAIQYVWDITFTNDTMISLWTYMYYWRRCFEFDLVRSAAWLINGIKHNTGVRSSKYTLTTAIEWISIINEALNTV